MVDYIEGLNARLNIKAFGHFELAADRAVHVEIARCSQHVMARISEGSQRIHRKRSRVHPLILFLRVAGLNVEWHARDNVGPVKPYAGQGAVSAVNRVYGESSFITHQRCDLPVA